MSALSPTSPRWFGVEAINQRLHRQALNVFLFIVLAHWVEHLVQAYQVWVPGPVAPRPPPAPRPLDPTLAVARRGMRHRRARGRAGRVLRAAAAESRPSGRPRDRRAVGRR
jgi:hypothetical protein